jgi:hypothetical protein
MAGTGVVIYEGAIFVGTVLGSWLCFCNICRVHQKPAVTPAVKAGLRDQVWTLEEPVDLFESYDIAG